jgi:hypothetical protein
MTTNEGPIIRLSLWERPNGPDVIAVTDRDGNVEVLSTDDVTEEERDFRGLALAMADANQIPLNTTVFSTPGDATNKSVYVPDDQTFVCVTDTVFVVWGPTAEHGDGRGPRAYFFDRPSARNWLLNERRDLEELRNEDGSWPWPYDPETTGALDIRVTSVQELQVPLSIRCSGRDATLRYLNEEV